MLLDTSSLLHDAAEATLKSFFVPLVEETGQRLVVPLRVHDEVRKHLASSDAALRAKAERAADLIARYRALNLIDLFSDGEATFADNVIQFVVVRHCERYHFCVLTQDRDLATDVLRLGTRRSVARAKSVIALRVGDDGGLDEWYARDRSDAAWRPIERARAVREIGPEPFKLATGNPRPPGAPLRTSKPVGEGDLVMDGTGRRYRLERQIGAGGEGAVFATDSEYVCKTYRPERLTTALEEKLSLMIASPIEHPAVCWPRSLARDPSGNVVGYLMPAARGKELQRAVFVKPLLLATFPSWTRIELVELALSAIEPLRVLHDRNVILGDINPLNILVASEREVYFVDCDSYQIEDFACPVGTATFLAPELIGRRLDGVLRDFSQERFAVATLVFMLLMPGKPPYSHAGGGDPAENVRARHFPYGIAEKKGERVPAGPWRFIWSHFPFYMKEAFHDVFTDDRRLATAEWIDLLRRYQSDLRRDFVSRELFPTGFKRLRKEDVRRKGGKWVECRECGEGFGSFESAADICATCSVREVEAKCFLCGKGFLARAAQLRRLGDREPFCDACRTVAWKRPCRECFTPFTLPAGDRAYFKRKGLSLPSRCKACREKRKGVGVARPAPAAPTSGPSIADLFEQAIRPPRPRELTGSPPVSKESRPGGLLDALRRLFGGS